MKENKNNEIVKYIIIGILLIFIGIVLFVVISNNKKKLYVLDNIYNVYPKEVRELYQNMVDVSCYGDLYFDIEMEKTYNINKLDSKYLVDYMFSYLDKNGLLSNSFDSKIIKDTEEKLFDGNINLLNNINNYSYGNYIYDISNNKVSRKESNCVSGNKYVSHLYSYMYDSDKLYIDVNIAYLKDGVLYNFDDKELGNYSGDRSNLTVLMDSASYYRITYVKKNGEFKLDKIKWMKLA